MTTNWGPIVYPTALDTFLPLMIDNVDEVIANHPNSLAQAITALEAKVNIDNEPVIGSGGLQFDVTGHGANPGVAGQPTFWIGNVSPTRLYFTDDLGTDYDLLSGIGYGIGTNVVCGVPLAVGDLVHFSLADTVVLADAVVGDIAHGMVVSVYGGGLLCDVVYTGREIVNPLWALVPGTLYYLDINGTFGTVPPMGWTVQQEIGFARNATTLVFRSTLATT
jgi:hypothetical protein